MTVVVRPLGASDLDAVRTIESVSYPAPWSQAIFASELARSASRSRAAVDTETGELIGYVVLARYVDEWHVLNVAVAPSRRREGIATTLLERIFAETDGDGARGYTLEVRVSNAGALALYERLGFVRSGVRPRYYRDNGEDAVIMWRHNGGARTDAV